MKYVKIVSFFFRKRLFSTSDNANTSFLIDSDNRRKLNHIINIFSGIYRVAVEKGSKWSQVRICESEKYLTLRSFYVS